MCTTGAWRVGAIISGLGGILDALILDRVACAYSILSASTTVSSTRPHRHRRRKHTHTRNSFSDQSHFRSSLQLLTTPVGVALCPVDRAKGVTSLPALPGRIPGRNHGQRLAHGRERLGRLRMA